MTGETIRNVAIAVLLLGSSALCLTAAAGIIRFRDSLARLHAITKPQVLGLMLAMSAVFIAMPSWRTLTTIILVAGFQMLTAPVAGHMIGRAGYRTGDVQKDELFRDDLDKAVEDATLRQRRK